MADNKINYVGDPFASDVITTGQYPRIKSVYYSGPYSNIVAPGSANYPVNTPTRYFMRLPVAPDTSDLSGLRPMSIYDVTSGILLTKVSSSPGTNQYAVAPSASRSNDVIELNSSQAGKTIGFDYYGTGSIMHSEDFNNPIVPGTLYVNTITDRDSSPTGVTEVTSILSPTAGMRSKYISSSVSFTDYDNIKTVFVDLGGWNMNTTPARTYNITTSWTYSVILSITPIIRTNINAFSYYSYYNGNINQTGTATEIQVGPLYVYSGTLTFLIAVRSGSTFQTSTDFSGTTASRGFLKIDYK